MREHNQPLDVEGTRKMQVFFLPDICPVPLATTQMTEKDNFRRWISVIISSRLVHIGQVVAPLVVVGAWLAPLVVVGAWLAPLVVVGAWLVLG